MTQATELRTLLHLLRGQRRRGSHAQSLRDFYAPQAEGYDEFRERLLHGRETLVHLMAPPARGRVVEMGCGTGRNLDFFGARVETFQSFDLVDVCVPLLEQARRRAARWPGIVNVVEADAENYRPDHAVDCVYFSYSLSMTADWRKALCNAVRKIGRAHV